MFIEKVANGLIGGGSVTSVYFGFTPGQWQVIGIVSGIGIGVAGLVVKAAVDIYYKAQHLKLARLRVGLGDDE
jgi:hypothetical protein